MIKKLANIQKALATLPGHNCLETAELYSGITLFRLSLTAEHFSMRLEPFGRVLFINYCRRGRMVWNIGLRNSLYLGQGDFSLHTMETCTDSDFTLPTGAYEGLAVCIDLEKLAAAAPELLSGTGITGEFLYKKFCKDTPFTSFAGNEQAEQIFSAFYGQSERLALPYQKIKVIELLFYLSELEVSPESRLTKYQSEQIEIIREIHEQLTEHMEQRFTIDALSKQYLINPTTLKTAFKSVYGASIAAHIKEHRMEQAAKLLRETDLSISEVARMVGYDSQSKFASAFKDTYGQLPKAFRKAMSLK